MELVLKIKNIQNVVYDILKEVEMVLNGTLKIPSNLNDFKTDNYIVYFRDGKITIKHRQIHHIILEYKNNYWRYTNTINRDLIIFFLENDLSIAKILFNKFRYNPNIPYYYYNKKYLKLIDYPKTECYLCSHFKWLKRDADVFFK